MKSKIFLLKLSSLSHMVFIFGSIYFVLMNSISQTNAYIDSIALTTFISFFVFRRCIAVDIYQNLKQDLNQHELPLLARDTLSRDILKKIFRKFYKSDIKIDKEKEKEIADIRLDILKNIEPFLEQNDKNIVSDMYNRKIQYIISNFLIGSILITKYNMKYMNLALVGWLLVTFPIS